jgi:hypothetical protein
MDESGGTAFRTSTHLTFVFMLLVGLPDWAFVQVVFALPGWGLRASY